MSTKLEKFMLSISEVYWIVFLSLQRMQKKVKKKLFELSMQDHFSEEKKLSVYQNFSRELLYVFLCI